jgi:hypothetical protein
LSAEPFRRLEEKDFISVKPEQITRLVHESGALDRARLLAREFADRAKASLNGGGSGDYSRALQTVPDFILARDSSLDTKTGLLLISSSRHAALQADLSRGLRSPPRLPRLPITKISPGA